MKIARIIATIIIPIMILLFCFRLFIFNVEFYDAEFEKHNIHSIEPKADQALTNLLSYLEHGTELDSELFSEREIAHLKDVRSLVWTAIFTLTILFLLFIVLLLRFFYVHGYKSISHSFLIGGSVSLFIALLIIILSIFSFDKMFNYFHLILFRNDLWLLPEGSMLVRILPIGFFYDVARKIMLNSVYLSVFFLILGYGSRYIKEN